MRTRPWVGRLVVSAVVLTTTTACATARRAAAPGFLVTADSSLYTPVLRLRTDARRSGDRVRVRVHGGSIAVPGEPITGAPPLMSRLHLTAVLAIADTGVVPIDGLVRSDRRSWTQIAVSDSVLVAPELHYGETRPIPTLTLDVPVARWPTGTRPFIVFRLRGNTVELRPPETPGGAPLRRDRVGWVLVYACGDRDIDGQPMPDRAAGLRRAYGVAC